ncbi:hypothetical protein AB7W42_10330 [Providencia rettgeri]
MACLAAFEGKKVRDKNDVKLDLGTKITYYVYIALFFCIGFLNLFFVGYVFGVYDVTSDSFLPALLYGVIILIILANVSMIVYGKIGPPNSESQVNKNKDTAPVKLKKYKNKKKR